MFLSNNLNSILTLVLVCTLFAFSSCKKDEPDQLVTISKDDYNEEEMNTISERLSDEFLNHPDEFPILSENNFSAAYGYVRQLMNTMVNTSLVENRSTLNWDFVILQDDASHRSFGLPNGTIHMTTGLLKMMENESQFAALLSHEIYYLDNNLIMPTLVDEYGGKIFGDMLLNKPVESSGEIAMRIKEMSFESPVVESADEFAMNNVCPFEYEAGDFKKLIQQLHNLSIDVDWLIMRPGGSQRIQKIINSSAHCDDEEPLEETRYQMFKNNLLP